MTKDARRWDQTLIDSALWYFGWIWVGLAFAAGVISTFNLFMPDPYFVQGYPTVLVMWLMVVAILFAPGIGALYWARRRRRSGDNPGYLFFAAMLGFLALLAWLIGQFFSYTRLLP